MEKPDEITDESIEAALTLLNGRGQVRRKVEYDPETTDCLLRLQIETMDQEDQKEQEDDSEAYSDIEIDLIQPRSGLQSFRHDPIEAPMNSSLFKFNLKNGELMATDSPLDKEEEVVEVEKETEEARNSRRSTLVDSVMKVKKKVWHGLLSSIDIRHMVGNIYPNLILKKNPQEVFETHCLPKATLSCLRRSKSLLKAYIRRFKSQAAILLEILVDLIQKALFIINGLLNNYSFVKDILNAWRALHAVLEKKEELGFQDLPPEQQKKHDQALTRIIGLYHEILAQQTNFEKSMQKWVKKLKQKLVNAKGKGILKDIIIKITELETEYLTVFSQTVRWIYDREDVYNNVDPNRNLFIIENRICSFLKAFRQNLDKKVINRLYALNAEIDEGVRKHHDYLKKRVVGFNELITHTFPLKWTQGFMGLINERLSEGVHILRDRVNMFKLLRPGYRKYMKKKLGLSSRAFVGNDDLLDFFEFLNVKYMVESPLMVGFFKCLSKAPSEAGGGLKKTLTILTLDVSVGVLEGPFGCDF